MHVGHSPEPLGHGVVGLSADHFFIGKHDDIGGMVVDFQVTYLG